MRILHTSDWHIGRKIHNHDVHDFQRLALDHLVDSAIAQQVTAVVVSGDVFDGPVPSVDSLRLLNHTLTRLHNAGIVSVLTAGNHDQAERLAVNANLLLDTVHIVGTSKVCNEPIELSDEHGPVLIYPITFLWPDHERHTLSQGDEPLGRSHLDVTKAAVDLIKSDLAAREASHGGPLRTIVMSHAFVTRSGEAPAPLEAVEVSCDSERDISIGGVQTVPAYLFDGFTYVALGHLHRPQEVTMPSDSATVTRYSGSLLRYTLSETAHEKSFAIVELGAVGVAPQHELISIPQGRGMARLTGTLDELLAPDKAKHYTDFVELVVTDEVRPDHVFERLKSKYEAILSWRYSPHGATVVYDNGKIKVNPQVSTAQNTQEFIERVTERAANEDEINLINEVLDEMKMV